MFAFRDNSLFVVRAQTLNKVFKIHYRCKKASLIRI